MRHRGELLQKLTDSTMRIPFSSMTLRILSKQNGIGPIFSQQYSTNWKNVMLVCGLHQILQENLSIIV